MNRRAGGLDPDRAIADLRELHALTGNAQGAQRLAWTDTWEQARSWLRAKFEALPVDVEVDEAGNLWATLRGRSSRAVALGSHIDSIVNGGWLDGVLGVVAGLEVLRRVSAEGTPPFTLRVVDWSDEEGARFSTGCLGSGMASGRLRAESIRRLQDKEGVRLEDAMRARGIDIDRAHLARHQLSSLSAYLELHIEQGPVLEQLGLSMGAVIGTYGVERHVLRFRGQAAHAGATPMPLRRDSFMAAAETAVAVRDIARRHGGVATTGRVENTPGLVTVVAGATLMSLDLRNFDGRALAAMLDEASKAAAAAASANGCSVDMERTWAIDPIHFDAGLVSLAAEAAQAECGSVHRLPSGPLHDAAEMQAAGIPSVMLFVQSLGGLSHAREEDTREADLVSAIRALDALTTRVMRRIATE